MITETLPTCIHALNNLSDDGTVLPTMFAKLELKSFNFNKVVQADLPDSHSFFEPLG